MIFNNFLIGISYESKQLATLYDQQRKEMMSSIVLTYKSIEERINLIN